MLKILSGVALAALTATAAFAADLPLKAPAAAPVKFTWTGCFIGGHVGGVVREDRSTNLLGASANFNSIGGQAGTTAKSSRIRSLTRSHRATKMDR